MTFDTRRQRARLEEALDAIDRTIDDLQRTERQGNVPEPEADQGDTADAAAVMLDGDTSTAVLGVAEGRRTQLTDALARISSGTYGTCLACGEVIPDDRLTARPEATRHVECQEKVDVLQT